MVAVNKIDSSSQDHLAADFYSLGVDRLYPISAEHGVGVEELIQAVVAELPKSEEADADVAEAGQRRTAVAIIGRPNVGKSSLLNRLAGFERAIVSSLPGTTRDPLDTPVSHDGKDYL